MDSLAKKHCVDEEIDQIIEIFVPYWSKLKAGKYYAWSWSKAVSHAFGREEEGSVLGNIEVCVTRNLCECLLFFYGEICGILENVPRFLKNAINIPEERHLGLTSLVLWVRLNEHPQYMFKLMGKKIISINAQ